MQQPGYLPLLADRFTAFGASFSFEGENWMGKTFKGQVRPSVNDTGTPLANLGIVTNPLATGIRILVSTPTTTILAFTIDKATITAMAASSGLTGDALTEDKDLTFAWDLLSVDASGVEEVLMNGPFILRAGVYQ